MLMYLKKKKQTRVGISVILTNIKTGKTFKFISLRSAIRFIKENYPQDAITQPTVKSRLKQGNYLEFNGWILNIVVLC